MSIPEASIFLLTSGDRTRKKVFGTGFALAHRDNQLYILTCAHVVKQLNGSVRINDQVAEVVAQGAPDLDDLALLRIPCADPPLLLNQVTRGTTNTPVTIYGYGSFSGSEIRVGRSIEGKLGKSITFQSVDSAVVNAWDLHIDDNEFSRLQGGYSGSPLCDSQGCLIGVVNLKVGDGRLGHAITIGTLLNIYPQIKELVPSLADFDDNVRIQQIMSNLASRMFEILEVSSIIGQELKRMQDQGIAASDEATLTMVERFLKQEIEAQAFTDFCRKLTRGAGIHNGHEPDFSGMADRLRRGRVVLCLGQELSHFLNPRVPSTTELIAGLASDGIEFHGPLSELCEQQELSLDVGRYELKEKIRALLNPTQPDLGIELYNIIAGLDIPLLIISAAYDDLLEQSLRERRKFVQIYPDLHDKHFSLILRYSDSRDQIVCSPEDLSHQSLLEDGYIVIYKLRGGFLDNDQETLLLSERDYLGFNRVRGPQFPDYILTKLNNHMLWFLGHHPTSWEERLLVRAIQEWRDNRTFALAVQQDMSDFTGAFWKDSNVQICKYNITDFIHNVGASL